MIECSQAHVHVLSAGYPLTGLKPVTHSVRFYMLIWTTAKIAWCVVYCDGNFHQSKWSKLLNILHHWCPVSGNIYCISVLNISDPVAIYSWFQN